MIAALSGAFVVWAAPASAQVPRFEMTEVAKGVFAVVRTEPSANVVNGNSVVIVNDSDVVVVDAHGTPAAAKKTIAAIRKLTRKPVRYLVSTHWHDDHVMGNQAYADAYPGIEFIGHPNTREGMTTDAVGNRQNFVKSLPGILDFVRKQIAAGKGLDGGTATPEELRSLRADVALGELYLAEAPNFRITPPTLTVPHRLTITRGERVIDIRHFGPANSQGDLVVSLPKEGVVITGDLVVYPTPFFFKSDIGGWISALDSVKSLDAKIIVPGHGPVMRNYDYVDLVSAALTAVRSETRAARARGLTLDQTRDSVKLDELRRRFAGDDRVKNGTWANYFLGPAIAAEYEAGGDQ